MARFTILGKQLTDAQIESLKALIREADDSIREIVVVDAIGDPDPDVDDGVVLVVGTPTTCADPTLEMNLKRATNGTQRAIWVWPRDSKATELPPAAAKYSYSCVPWDAEKLRAVAADDDVTCFQTASGEPIPTTPTERNLCVEVKAKT